MTGAIERTRRLIAAFYKDTRGVILPYAALMVVVFVALSALALDVGRQASLQTQMQAAADALALAGARELNQRSGAENRATNAINNLVSNGLTGMGVAGSIASASVVFYSSLPAASSGSTGTAATGDADAKFVAVTVSPKTIQATLSTFFSPTMTASGRAIAGQIAPTACGVSPIFICNPYETSGMSDNQATQALNAALDPNDPSFNIATLRKLIRWDKSNTSPGHFGLLEPPDGCNSTPCLKKWMASDTWTSLNKSCYAASGVKMATGNKPVVGELTDRFDVYGSNGPSASYAPSINVRKGHKYGGDWCDPQSGDYLAAQTTASATSTTIALTPAVTNISAAAAKNATSITVQSIANIQAGMSISTGTGASASVVGTVKAPPAGTTVTIPNPGLSVAVANGTQLTFSWQTAPLPLDQNWTGICSGGTCLQGDGNWDCLNYWKINHGTATPPAGCTSNNPTVSRYDVYNYENSHAGDIPTASPISDWSGIPQGVANAPNAETGAPMCAINGGFTPTWDPQFDSRILYVAVVNCLAQTALGNISGGNSGSGTPAAGFAKMFLTQPYGNDGTTYQYGEMVGLVGLSNTVNDKVVLYNNVQMYR